MTNTYRKDLYYVNWDYYGNGTETVVSKPVFYWYWITNFWRAKRDNNVLRIKMHDYD